MSLSQPTLEDIWKLFQENREEIREMREMAKEADRRYREYRELADEAERKRRESAEQAERERRDAIAQAERERCETIAQAERERREAIAQMEQERREMAEQLAREHREILEQAERKQREKDEEERKRRELAELEYQKWREEWRQERLEIAKATDLKIKEANESIARLGSKLGDYVEEMVRPAAVRLFKDRGIDVHEVHQNVTAKRRDGGIEVDLLVVNDGDVIAIECKSTLSIDDVNEHLERLEKLKRMLPSYACKNVMGAVTGMVIPDNVASYAYRRGLFVIAQTGDQLALRNDEKFVAKVW